MHWSGPVQGPSPEWRRAIFCGVLFLFFSPTFVHGQDVAEAARQEQARKAEQQKTPPHVYTEEDLKRKKILTPEDQARVEARKKEMEKAPAQVDAEQLPRNDGSSETESLGEVARRYRREKEAREAVEAEEKKFAPFPYKVPESSLAVVKPEVAPAARISPRVNLKNGASPMPALAPHSSPSATAPHARVSPFQRRPLVGAPPARVLAPFVAHSAAAPVSNSAMPVIAPAATSSEVAATPSRSSRVSRPAPVNPLPSPVKAGMQRVQVERGESWWRLARR